MVDFLVSSIMMLFGEICVNILKEMGLALRSRAIDSDDPCVYLVEIVGMVKSYDETSVRVFFIQLVFY
jgi:hypothetical protein